MYYNTKRLLLTIFWIALGAGLFVASTIFHILDTNIFAGMGGGFMGVGLLQLNRYFKYHKNKAYKEKIDTEMTDERNKFLSMKAWSFTGYIVVLLNAICAVVAFFMNHSDLTQLFVFSECILVCIYWITYTILSKRY